jgi:hypothetical protein
MPDFRVLGCDPGRLNFAWAVYGDKGLEDHGVIEGAPDLDALTPAAARFERIIQHTEPNACVLERFHQRPGKGAIRNMELVNLMIGQCLIICRHYRVPWDLVTASTHKKWTPLHFDVELSTKKHSGVGKKYDIGTYVEWRELTTEHEVDAANLAKYAHDHRLLDLRRELEGE